MPPYWSEPVTSETVSRREQQVRAHLQERALRLAPRAGRPSWGTRLATWLGTARLWRSGQVRALRHAPTTTSASIHVHPDALTTNGGATMTDVC